MLGSQGYSTYPNQDAFFDPMQCVYKLSGTQAVSANFFPDTANIKITTAPRLFKKII